MRYDCFGDFEGGDFEGFVIETCEAEHIFASRERPIERVAHRACAERSRVTVCFDARRIRSIEIRCVGRGGWIG